jgi:PPM family protein phosphatase
VANARFDLAPGASLSLFMPGSLPGMRRQLVELMTSGEFARASGLSRKALRLYDELDLLRPAVVDPVSQYRRYHPAQLEQARLVAWLRRLGMPLASISEASTAPPAQAADLVRAYWDRVETETAARRELAAFLIGYLSGRDTSMHDAQKTLAIRCAVQSDVGLAREDNEDSAYAGARLIAVADGMGGHAAGEVASATVIEALRPLDTEVPAGELLNALDHAVRQASRTLGDMARSDPALRDMGTTLTALLWSGSQLGLVHIGDSRAYLVRDGEVFQITQDHTLVKSLLDDGKITPAEIASHPQRNLLLRALVPATATFCAPTACTRWWTQSPSRRSCAPSTIPIRRRGISSRWQSTAVRRTT